jgi:hypothetical protein
VGPRAGLEFVAKRKIFGGNRNQFFQPVNAIDMHMSVAYMYVYTYICLRTIERRNNKRMKKIT